MLGSDDVIYNLVILMVLSRVSTLAPHIVRNHGPLCHVVEQTFPYRAASLSGAHLDYCQVHLNRVTWRRVLACTLDPHWACFTFLLYCLAVQENVLASCQLFLLLRSLFAYHCESLIRVNVLCSRNSISSIFPFSLREVLMQLCCAALAETHI